MTHWTSRVIVVWGIASRSAKVTSMGLAPMPSTVRRYSAAGTSWTEETTE